MAITQIHHLNCGTMCPPAAALVGGKGWFRRGRMVCHCLLIETSGSGLVLVDTGIGTGDIDDQDRFHRGYRLVAPAFDRNETALAQVVELGYQPDDVRHIVVTHLDFDHAGGLADFPGATVHLHAIEHQAAMEKPSFAESVRYVSAQWAHEPAWRTYDDAGDTLFGLAAIRQLEGTGEEIALIPLFGHTRGHTGVAVRQIDGDGWLLHAGDAYFNHRELHAAADGPWGLRLFQRLVQIDGEARMANADRLRELYGSADHEVDIFCAHDPVELARYQLTESDRTDEVVTPAVDQSQLA